MAAFDFGFRQGTDGGDFPPKLTLTRCPSAEIGDWIFAEQ
jgi:hypothetical protein